MCLSICILIRASGIPFQLTESHADPPPRTHACAPLSQVLNGMNSYGCDGRSGLPPGIDKTFVMCTHTFFDCDWVNDTQLVHTGSNASDYTTSVMGNQSVAWIRSVLEQGKTHPPFYAWIGPHAPHLPSTPAPWYSTHPIGLLKPPRADQDPRYNYSGVDHHPLVAGQPAFTEQDATAIEQEYALRMRSLLSVDDLIVCLGVLLSCFFCVVFPPLVRDAMVVALNRTKICTS